MYSPQVDINAAVEAADLAQELSARQKVLKPVADLVENSEYAMAFALLDDMCCGGKAYASDARNVVQILHTAQKQSGPAYTNMTAVFGKKAVNDCLTATKLTHSAPHSATNNALLDQINMLLPKFGKTIMTSKSDQTLQWKVPAMLSESFAEVYFPETDLSDRNVHEIMVDVNRACNVLNVVVVLMHFYAKWTLFKDKRERLLEMHAQSAAVSDELRREASFKFSIRKITLIGLPGKPKTFYKLRTPLRVTSDTRLSDVFKPQEVRARINSDYGDMLLMGFMDEYEDDVAITPEAT